MAVGRGRKRQALSDSDEEGPAAANPAEGSGPKRNKRNVVDDDSDEAVSAAGTEPAQGSRSGSPLPPSETPPAPRDPAPPSDPAPRPTAPTPQAADPSDDDLSDDASGDEEDDDASIASDDLYENEEERERMESEMGELEREQILAERRERILRERQRKKVLRMGKAERRARREAERKGKRSTRTRTKAPSAAQDALKEIEAAREGKRAGRTKVVDEETLYGDAFGDEEGPGPRGDGEWAASEEEEERAANLQDIRSITVRRQQLCQWIEYPHFAEVLEGALVRVSVGVDEAGAGDGGRPANIYRLARVLRVIEAPGGSFRAGPQRRKYVLPYAVAAGGPTTNRFLEVQVPGFSAIPFPLSQVSDAEVKQEEFIFLRNRMAEKDMPEIRTGEVERVRAQLARAAGFAWTEEAVLESLRAKAKVDPAAEKAALVEAIEDARDRGPEGEGELAELQQRLAELEARAAERAGKGRAPSGLDSINRRNLAANHSNVLKNVGFRLGDDTLPENWARRREAPTELFADARERDAAPGAAAGGPGPGEEEAAAAEEEAAEVHAGSLKESFGLVDMDKVRAVLELPGGPRRTAADVATGPGFEARVRATLVPGADAVSWGEYRARNAGGEPA